MTRDDIIRMGQECGLLHATELLESNQWRQDLLRDFVRFADMVAQKAALAATLAESHRQAIAWGAKCHQMTEAERYLTAEAIRQAFAKLPKSSFMLNAGGGVSRVDDSCGSWVNWHDAHVLFDPEQVDAAIKKMEGQT